MKKIYLIGGAMGVGKTTVAQILKTKLSNSVFLDGDWCWDSDPFQVTEETKIMVKHDRGHAAVLSFCLVREKRPAAGENHQKYHSGLFHPPQGAAL